MAKKKVKRRGGCVSGAVVKSPPRLSKPSSRGRVSRGETEIKERPPKPR